MSLEMGGGEGGGSFLGLPLPFAGGFGCLTIGLGGGVSGLACDKSSSTS